MGETTRTFETRIHVDPSSKQILHDCAHLFAHIEHRLFADIAAGKAPSELKNLYLACYEITARQFNALRVKIEGKIASIKSLRPLQITEAKERISSLEVKLKKLIKRKGDTEIIHQKKRRLNNLRHKLEQLKEDHKQGIVRCCFGSKKLFRAQFNLEKNGYTSHEEWLQDWRDARASEIFFLGSKDETAGNQTCTATIQPDGTLQLRIRLPDALKQGKYLVLPGIRFNYGKQELHSLLNSQDQAISWRFLHDKKGWRVFATFDVQPIPCTSRQNIGVIGLDINVDHFALVETDRSGNPISKKIIPFNLQNKSSHQIRAQIGDAAASAIDYADNTHKPLILEDLDFQQKKTQLRENHLSSHARMLSSFAYKSMITHLKSRAIKKGISVHQVNPAYTSLIGRVKYASRYGLSTHQAAALTIGRRYLRCSEQVPSTLRIPDGKDGHVTLTPPVRKRDKHVWSIWRHISKKLRTALEAHFRTAKDRSKSPPKQAPETRKSPRNAGETPARESSELLFA